MVNTLDTSSRSRAGEASRLRQFARYLNALGIPAIEIESVRVSSDYVAHNFTDDEIARIIDAADNLISHMNVFVVKEYFPLILRILIGCGMRITEVLELRWTDINLDTGVITVVNAKNKRQRFVPMHQSLTDMLKLYQKRIRRFDKNSFVFENLLDFDKPLWVSSLQPLVQSGFTKSQYTAHEANIPGRGDMRSCCYDTTSHLILFRNLKKKNAAFMIPHHFCRHTWDIPILLPLQNTSLMTI